MRIFNFEEISIQSFLNIHNSLLTEIIPSFELHFQFIRIVVSLESCIDFKGKYHSIRYDFYPKEESFKYFTFSKDLDRKSIETNLYISTNLTLTQLFKVYFENYKAWKDRDTTSFFYLGENKIIVNRSVNGVYELIKEEGGKFLFDDIKILCKVLVLSTKEFILSLTKIEKSKISNYVNTLYGVLHN